LLSRWSACAAIVPTAASTSGMLAEMMAHLGIHRPLHQGFGELL
jgi:hypothetical protein